LFGITYGVLLIPMHMAMLGASVMMLNAPPPADPQFAGTLKTLATVLLAYSGIMLPYCVVVFVLCIGGRTVGLVMGIVHSALMIFLNLGSQVFAQMKSNSEPPPGAAIGLGLFITLLILGLIQYNGRHRNTNPGMPHQTFIGPPLRPEPGGVNALATGPAANPVPNAALAVKPKPVLSKAQQAFIELLGIAASMDDSQAEPRLKRARQVANQVLGSDHRTAVMTLLNDPTLIGNLQDDLNAVAKQLREDEKLRALAPKAAAAVMKDDDTLDDHANELLRHLELGLA